MSQRRRRWRELSGGRPDRRHGVAYTCPPEDQATAGRSTLIAAIRLSLAPSLYPSDTERRDVFRHHAPSRCMDGASTRYAAGWSRGDGPCVAGPSCRRVADGELRVDLPTTTVATQFFAGLVAVFHRASPARGCNVARARRCLHPRTARQMAARCAPARSGGARLVSRHTRSCCGTVLR